MGRDAQTRARSQTARAGNTLRGGRCDLEIGDGRVARIESSLRRHFELRSPRLDKRQSELYQNLLLNLSSPSVPRPDHTPSCSFKSMFKSPDVGRSGRT